MITLIFLIAAAVCWLIAAIGPPPKPNLDALAKCLVTVAFIFYVYHAVLVR